MRSNLIATGNTRVWCFEVRGGVHYTAHVVRVGLGSLPSRWPCTSVPWIAASGTATTVTGLAVVGPSPYGAFLWI